MVCMFLSRAAYDEMMPRLRAGRDAVWVNKGILSGDEQAALHAAGWDVTTWTSRHRDLTAEIDVVRLHHPGQVVWMETSPAEGEEPECSQAGEASRGDPGR